VYLIPDSILCESAFTGFLAFGTILRFGTTFPRFGRWRLLAEETLEFCESQPVLLLQSHDLLDVLSLEQLDNRMAG
jgi:hypothetical protein